MYFTFGVHAKATSNRDFPPKPEPIVNGATTTWRAQAMREPVKSRRNAYFYMIVT